MKNEFLIYINFETKTVLIKILKVVAKTDFLMKILKLELLQSSTKNLRNY